MVREDLREYIQKIEEEIEELPKGYITYKRKANNRSYPYHQWTENGKKTSLYVKEGEVALLSEKIEQRKRLEAELKKAKATVEKKVKSRKFKDDFKTTVTIGESLEKMSIRDWKKRYCFEVLHDYLYSSERDKVCLVYGLRRTGKTTMLRQAIGEMSQRDLDRTAYIKARREDTMAMMNHDLKLLQEEGYQYIFIDEVTLLSDFIDSAALFSDVFASMGMKIVLSGTDSLGFWLAMDEELYDRAKLIHTTFIPFREYSYLLGIDSIDEYIRYGGTLRLGETAFGEIREEASFYDDESTRRYIDTAICKNIQHSLACYQNGGHFRHLYSLYEAHELTGAINRIIEDMNHRFVLEVLTKDFVSSDLGISARNLRKERDENKRSDILDRIDIQLVTDTLMKILEIRNKEEQTMGITNDHMIEIKEYLKALDLIENCSIELAISGISAMEHILFVQPGMRYCQAQALVYALLHDETFINTSEEQKTFVINRILEEVRGRMMEDIILLETSKALSKQYKVFKLQFARGEFDMVIYDKKDNNCTIYEIKHSQVAVEQQARHLLDEEKCSLTTRRFGEIKDKIVLYLGDNLLMDSGIIYKNVEEYLRELPINK